MLVRMGEKNLHTLLVWNSVWRFIKRLKIYLPYNPAIPFLGTYLKESKSTYKRDDTCTPMFIAAKHNSQAVESA
jgi:hypothetical protein